MHTRSHNHRTMEFANFATRFNVRFQVNSVSCVKEIFLRNFIQKKLHTLGFTFCFNKFRRVWLSSSTYCRLGAYATFQSAIPHTANRILDLLFGTTLDLIAQQKNFVDRRKWLLIVFNAFQVLNRPVRKYTPLIEMQDIGHSLDQFLDIGILLVVVKIMQVFTKHLQI